MHDWNVIVTVHEHQYNQARHFLEQFGTVARTDFFNVVTLQVDDCKQFLDDIQQQLQTDTEIAQWLSRVMPVSRRFMFQSPAEFEEQARTAVLPWLEQLDGQRFHVRMHRRGFKGRLSSQDEERFLDHFLMQQLSGQGKSAEINFDDPDYIIAIETIGQEAGLSLWRRDELQRHSLLKLD